MGWSEAFGAGAIAGAAVTAVNSVGLGVPYLGAGLKVVAGVSTTASVIGGTIKGLSTGDWSGLANAGKTLVGLFYLDSNRDFLGQLWQGFSRHTWESPQTLLGYNYTQWRNATGSVDRIDYFGGATFATGENVRANEVEGVSLGNYINTSIEGEINGNFTDYVTSNPLYMHEYGHTFDSRSLGLAYMFHVGIPSYRSSRNNTQVRGEVRNVGTHDFQWYEMHANRHAEKYFKKYYGVDWNTRHREGTYETYYPRNRR